MRSERKQSGILWYLLIPFGFLCLIAVRLPQIGPAYGLTTFLWLTVFLLLTQTAVTRLQLLLTGIALAAGYTIRAFGTTGVAIVDGLLLCAAAGIILGILLLYRQLSARLSSPLTTLLFPILWLVSYELLMLLRLPALLRIDSMFFDQKLLLQSEALIGSGGLSFLILWSTALLVRALLRRSPGAAVTCAGVFLLLLLFGTLRLTRAAVPEGYLRTAYATAPYTGDFLSYTAPAYDECIASFDRSVESAAAQKAAVLVFHEETFELPDTEEAAFLTHACDAARSSGLHILVGLDVTDTDDSHHGKSLNKIVWIDDRGQILDEYLKRKTIPILESAYQPGDGRIPVHTLTLDGREVTVAFAICYDSNFPHYLNQLPPETDILFLPSWDWAGIAETHYRICGTIAVEQHLTLLKPTYDGYTLAADPYGRILTLTSTDDTGYNTVLTVDLPIGRSTQS